MPVFYSTSVIKRVFEGGCLKFRNIDERREVKSTKMRNSLSKVDLSRLPVENTMIIFLQLINQIISLFRSYLIDAA